MGNGGREGAGLSVAAELDPESSDVADLGAAGDADGAVAEATRARGSVAPPAEPELADDEDEAFDDRG